MWKFFSSVVWVLIIIFCDAKYTHGKNILLLPDLEPFQNFRVFEDLADGLQAQGHKVYLYMPFLKDSWVKENDLKEFDPEEWKTFKVRHEKAWYQHVLQKSFNGGSEATGDLGHGLQVSSCEEHFLKDFFALLKEKNINLAILAGFYENIQYFAMLDKLDIPYITISNREPEQMLDPRNRVDEKCLVFPGGQSYGLFEGTEVFINKIYCLFFKSVIYPGSTSKHCSEEGQYSYIHHLVEKSQLWILDFHKDVGTPESFAPPMAVLENLRSYEISPIVHELIDELLGSPEQNIIVVDFCETQFDLNSEILHHMTKAFEDFIIIWYQDGVPKTKAANQVYFTTNVPLSVILSHPKTAFFISDGSNNINQNDFVNDIPIWLVPQTAKQHYNAYDIVTRVQGNILHNVTSEKLANHLQQYFSKNPNKEQLPTLAKETNAHTKDIKKLIHWVEHILYFGNVVFHREVSQLQSQEKPGGILHEIFITLAVVFALLFLATCVFLLGIIQGSRKRRAQQLPFQGTVSPSNEVKILETNGMLQDLKKLKEEFLSNIQKEALDATRQFTEDIQRRSSVSSQRSNPIPEVILNHENEFRCMSRKTLPYIYTPGDGTPVDTEDECPATSIKVIKNGDQIKRFQRYKSFDFEEPTDDSVLKLDLEDEETCGHTENRETPNGITMNHKTTDKQPLKEDLEINLDTNAKRVRDLIPLYSDVFKDFENREGGKESLKQMDPDEAMKSSEETDAKESPLKDDINQFGVKIENLISSLKNSVLQSSVRKGSFCRDDDTVTLPSDQSEDQNTSLSELSAYVESDSMLEVDRKRVKDLIPLYCEVSIDNEQIGESDINKENVSQLKDSFTEKCKIEPLTKNDLNVGNTKQEDTLRAQMAPSDGKTLDNTKTFNEKDSTHSYCSLTLENETKKVKDLIPLYNEELESGKTAKNPDISERKDSSKDRDSFNPCDVNSKKVGDQDEIATLPIDSFQNKSKKISGHENDTRWLKDDYFEQKKERDVLEQEFTASIEEENMGKQNENRLTLDNFKKDDKPQRKNPLKVETEDTQHTTNIKTDTYRHYNSRYFAGTRIRNSINKVDQERRSNEVKTKTIDKNEEDLSREWFASEVKKDMQWDSKGVPISLKLYNVQPYKYDDPKTMPKQTRDGDLDTKTHNGGQLNSGLLMSKQRGNGNIDLKAYNRGQPDMTLPKPNKEKFPSEYRNNFKGQYSLKSPVVDSSDAEQNQKLPFVCKDDSRKNKWVQDRREHADTKSNLQKRMTPFAYDGPSDRDFHNPRQLNRCISPELIPSNEVKNEKVNEEKLSHLSKQQNGHTSLPMTNTKEFVETVQYPYMNAWINMDETTAVSSIQEKEASREMLEKLQRISVSKEVRNIEAKQEQHKKEVQNPVEPNGTVLQEKKTTVWGRLKERVSRKYETNENFIKIEERRASFNSIDRNHDRKKADFQTGEDDFHRIKHRSSERSGNLSEGETQNRRGNARRRKSWFSDEECRSLKKKENPQIQTGWGDIRNSNGSQREIQRKEDIHDRNGMISNGVDPNRSCHRDTSEKTKMGTSAVEMTRRKRIPARRPRETNVFSSDDDLDWPQTSTQDMVTSIWLSTINRKDGGKEQYKQKQTETKKKPEPNSRSFQCENGRHDEVAMSKDEPNRTSMGVKQMAKYWQENNGGSLPRINASSRSNTFPRAQKQKTPNEIKRSSSRTEIYPVNSDTKPPKITNGCTDDKEIDIQDGSMRRKRSSKKASVHAMLSDILNRRKQPKDAEHKMNSRPSDSTKGSPSSIKSIRSGGNVLDKVSALLGKPRTPRTPRSFLARKNKIRHSKGSPHHSRKPLNGNQDGEKSMSPSPRPSAPPPRPPPPPPPLPPPPPPLPPASFGTKPKPTALKSITDVIKHSCLKKAFQEGLADNHKDRNGITASHTQKTCPDNKNVGDATEGNEFMDELLKKLEARRAYETD